MITECSILVVCTANICRSPYVEAILKHEFTGPNAARDTNSTHTRFRVASAGTRALRGAAMDIASAELLSHSGIDFDHSFTARQMTLQQITDSDLVLTMTREHRAQVLELAPAALRRTLTLREMAALLRSESVSKSASTPSLAHEHERAGDPRLAIRRIVDARSTHPELAQSPDADLADPYRQGSIAFTEMSRTVTDALTPIVAFLRSM